MFPSTHVIRPIRTRGLRRTIGAKDAWLLGLSRALSRHYPPGHMRRQLERFSNEKFDIHVSGGGATGACIARDAALRGFSVALTEKNDFAHATSAHNSKLVHGGLRYL